ncbi:MAG: twin-arginine translocase TatA/TatE family subunit [Clostridia bacterium]|nr:twin-arginine translocase TatA/TatE family subunit [Clostridia bacterium]
MRIGTTEILLIVVLALVLFGGNKLSGVGKALGKSIREFKEEVKPDEEKTPSEKNEEKA